LPCWLHLRLKNVALRALLAYVQYCSLRCNALLVAAGNILIWAPAFGLRCHCLVFPGPRRGRVKSAEESQLNFRDGGIESTNCFMRLGLWEFENTPACGIDLSFILVALSNISIDCLVENIKLSIELQRTKYSSLPI
jgi:hypothetical protein